MTVDRVPSSMLKELEDLGVMRKRNAPVSPPKPRKRGESQAVWKPKHKDEEPPF